MPTTPRQPGRRIAVLLLISSAIALLPAVEAGPLQVHRVIDGDTIEVLGDLGGEPLPVAVRLLWVDTPEIRGGRAMPEGLL
ncbi:MAG: hypothetical protein FKY71_17175 [Spiribacter salinus]|uniref:Nuclease n=1 Tax=Spiribacter salinus TaxID=1335746 RepID=A0A540VGT2_9GAMM|nr:MAG: hypothetical protein FKY71_17175 [Spiribacter salinus]